MAVVLSEIRQPNRQHYPIRFSNAYCVALASRDLGYRRQLQDAGVNFPDGAPIALYMQRNGGSEFAQSLRVRGPSFFELALRRGVDEGVRHFFLGSTTETMNRLVAAAHQRNPGIKIVGTYAPPFGPVSAELLNEATKRIADSKPDIVWVGMGTPKQDWVTAELSRMTSTTCAGVGAAFDFLAGTVREAPLWIQQSGLEWLFRLAMEPRRLWKRYLIGNFTFVYHAERYLHHGRRRSSQRAAIEAGVDKEARR
ncbi:WecB/TagA/CpsF family glycosyltransferase [Rhodococcus pseudokoreensis]|uniref:WecB/TagA/CpsF family glycosyltransferase n=1 Tax=Rhodococcus pseudokoreensis TaxID=2811421 RepID=UPI001F12338D|nr:WecB/TagA/CpsF family glycosyltransferase [Rhodococcus pseudokoreensis]